MVMRDLSAKIIELPVDDRTAAEIRDTYCLLESEDPFEFLDLVRELSDKHRPRNELERHLVEEAALAVFRQYRADMLEDRLMPPEAIRRAGRDPLYRRELERASKLIDDYRKSAQKQYRWALGELRTLQRDLDLPSAEVVRFPAKSGRRKRPARPQP
jgi:hypothetical protein